jgi:16S rRNA (guanine527-N7)-methyltransferase
MDTGNLVDLGGGGGFPGMPLRIAVPSLRACLIESNRKKAAFLAEVVRTLGLAEVEIAAMRFDEVRPSFGLSDFITARALGGFSELLRWAAQCLTPRGKIVLWIGQEDAERVAGTAGWIWQPAIKIPESQRRYLLVGRMGPES